eukprot:snap_masked-scaffold_51-processed-gene-1.19-mRNA-1 protein AED:1.00 eAED:1.00 QI:0/-1/0/0/-1/1/1/0/62
MKVVMNIDWQFFSKPLTVSAGATMSMVEKLIHRVSETRGLSERILELVVKLGQKRTITFYNC